MKFRASFLFRTVLLIGACAAYLHAASAPGVTVLPVPAVTVQPGKSTPIQMRFRVSDGFHINSSTPSSDLLIPTTVKLSPPSEILVGKVHYPAGQEFLLPAMPDQKLSVYSGAFEITGLMMTTKAITPGTYRVRGELKYQACSERQCFPPRTVPFGFNVKVVRGSMGHKGRNPAQSPNIRG